MADIISLLPDHVVNQIAAGEVIQRPSSVVKELIENSIDAQASEIKLLINGTGKTIIQVIDNGIGMSPADVRLASCCCCICAVVVGATVVGTPTVPDSCPKSPPRS